MILEIQEDYSLKYLVLDIMLLIAIYISRKFKIKSRFPRINGVYASRQQLELARELGIKQKFVNYKVGRYYLDMVYPRKKIAIEYNGSYWHSDKKKDTARAKELIKQGWKVLILEVSQKPPVEWVREQMKQLDDKDLVRVYWPT